MYILNNITFIDMIKLIISSFIIALLIEKNRQVFTSLRTRTFRIIILILSCTINEVLLHLNVTFFISSIVQVVGTLSFILLFVSIICLCLNLVLEQK